MAQFLREVVTQEVARVVSEVAARDLPVNPLSHLLLGLSVTPGAVSPSVQDLLAAWANIEVLFKGASIFSMNGQDAYRYAQAVLKREINVENFNQGGVLTRVILPVPFSRVPYWQEEAFPATRRGELVLRTTYAAAFTNLSAPVETVEAVSLLDASPVRFIKGVVNSRAVTAGDPDMELPIGNKLLGLLMFSPTAIDVAPAAATIRRARLLVDNVEFGYAEANHDFLRADGFLRISAPLHYFAGSSGWHNYGWMEFDPLGDGSYAVETDGRASVKLRFVVNTAGTVRVVPVELVEVGGAAPA